MHHVVRAPARIAGAAVKAQLHILGAPVAAATLVSFLFVFLMAGGFHRPTPHGLPLAIAAPPAAAAGIGSGLAAHAPGGFAVRRYAGLAAVERAVRHGDAVGGFALGGGGATIVTAGAQGVATGQVVEGALGAVARADRVPVRTVDVVPLPPGDSLGLSGFMVVIGLTLSGAIFASVTFATCRAFSREWLVAAAVTFSLLAGLGAALSVDVIVGAVGHFWEVAGVGALLALAVGGTVLAIGRLVGPAGLGLGALVAVLTSISTSGSVVGWRFEPAFHRALSQWLPAGSAVEALRGVLYFGGAHVAGRLAVLGVWAAAALVVLAIADSVRAHARPDAVAGL